MLKSALQRAAQYTNVSYGNQFLGEIGGIAYNVLGLALLGYLENGCRQMKPK
jgi:predicted house-cleaning NTP pyrophosphatase (Maf/HAM1 superfamily)